MRNYLFLILIAVLVIVSCNKNSAGIPGNIRKFDPIASYKKVHAFAGTDTELISIIAYFVKPDGTLDIKAANQKWFDKEKEYNGRETITKLENSVRDTF